MNNRYAASVIMSMTYGKATSTYNDPEVIQVNTSAQIVGRTMLPGAWLVDSYPILQYVPGYLSQLKSWHAEELQLFRGQLNRVRGQIVSVHADQLESDFAQLSERRQEMLQFRLRSI